jgi:hypothetical protein
MPSIFGPRQAYTIFAAFPTLRVPTPYDARAAPLVIPSSFVEDKWEADANSIAAKLSSSMPRNKGCPMDGWLMYLDRFFTESHNGNVIWGASLALLAVAIFSMIFRKGPHSR